MTHEHVEHTAANLSEAQSDYATAYESEEEGNQAFVSQVTPRGNATFHLHKQGEEDKVVTLDKKGDEVGD